MTKCAMLFKSIGAVAAATLLFSGMGCQNNKCGTGSACCSSDCKDGGDCKEGGECKGKGECKESGESKPATAPAAVQSTAPINTMCPIGGHDSDGTITAAYQGKTISFCCEDCKQEFAGMDEAGKAAVLAKATAK